MEHTANKLLVNNYFHALRKLDNETKKALIIKLTESIDYDEKEEDNEAFFALAGSWIDSRSAEEIIADIEGSRTNKPDGAIEKL